MRFTKEKFPVLSLIEKVKERKTVYYNLCIKYPIYLKDLDHHISYTVTDILNNAKVFFFSREIAFNILDDNYSFMKGGLKQFIHPQLCGDGILLYGNVITCGYRISASDELLHYTVFGLVDEDVLCFYSEGTIDKKTNFKGFNTIVDPALANIYPDL